MTDAVEANLGRRPDQASADAGRASQENLAGLEGRYRCRVAAGPETPLAAWPRMRSSPAPEKVGPRTRLKLCVPNQGWRTHQPRPGAQTTPRAGVRADQTGAGIAQFLLRGLEKVRAEWSLFCTAHSPPDRSARFATSDELMRQRRTLSIRRSGIGSPQRSGKHLARQSRGRGRDLCDDARPEDRRPEGYEIQRARASIASEENSSIRTP
jgi:hypothetical protein